MMSRKKQSDQLVAKILLKEEVKFILRKEMFGEVVGVCLSMSTGVKTVGK